MADNRCGNVAQLTDLPDDISVGYVKHVEISLKSRQQGYRYFSEGYFNNVKFFKGRDDNEIQVTAKCFRSQRKNEKLHLINLDISPGKVDLAHCSCTAGASGCCSHVIGLLLVLQHWQLMGLTDVPCELSCTSLPQQWNIPRGSKIEPAPAPSIVIVKPKPNRKRIPLRNKLTECRKIRVQDTDLEHLKSLDLPISTLVTKTSTKINTHLGEVSIGSGLSTHAIFYEDETLKASVETNCGNLQFPKTVNISDVDSQEL